jgi:hypothetical protein
MRASVRASRTTRTTRTAAQRAAGTRTAARKRTVATRTAKQPASKTATKPAPTVIEPMLFRFCKPGWAVLVERQPSQQGTRFVCPFCIQSHRVTGPVRGFRKVRKAQWIKMRRVDE